MVNRPIESRHEAVACLHLVVNDYEQCTYARCIGTKGVLLGGNDYWRSRQLISTIM